jgi:hypothetical protein
VNPFEEYAYRSAVTALEGLSAAKAADVYVVSLLVYDDDDDPRTPTLTVGTNTEERVRAGLPLASDSDEARWNYAYWLQDHLTIVGAWWRDPEGATLRQRWIEDLGLWYTDDSKERDFDAAMELGMKIAHEFVELTIRLAQRLHSTGAIERAFGKPIPALVHELEYYPEIAEQSQRANPPGLTDDFSRWVLGESDT